MLLAQKSYVEGALALILYCAPAGRRGAHRARPTDDRRRGAPAARRAHPDREELAVAVVPGGQRPGHPGARRLRLHPRVRRRAALPRQPAQPDPRGHARHPGPRPARPQGRHARRRRAGPARSTRSPTTVARRARPGGEPAELAPRRRGRPRRGSRGDRRRCGRRATRRVALANASVYLEAVGHVVVAWIWLEQLLAAHGRRRATSTTASARPPATSSATSCRGPARSSTCWRAWTGRRSTCATPGSDPRAQQGSTETTVGSSRIRSANPADSARVSETVQVTAL